MTDETAISVLRRFADLPSPQRLHDCITALHPLDQEKVHGLLNALDDDDANLRLLVVEVLFELDPVPASLPALINALEDPDRIVRIATVESVVRFGRKACAAIPILERWLDDEREYVRIAAAAAIGKIDPRKIPEIIPVLIEESEIRVDRLSAASAIRELRKHQRN